MLYPTIPTQLHGDFQDIVSIKCLDTIEEAVKEFEKLENRLRSVNEWHTFSEKIKTKFALFDPETNKSSTILKIGNLIKIDIPGPGNPSGSGYDWTRIIDIQTGEESQNFPFLAIRIKPCPAPDAKDQPVAHFYNDEASNTFIVRRMGTCLYAEVHGRNEIENTNDVPVLDFVRNKAIALGSKHGLGGLNWLGFTQAILSPAE